VTRNAHKHGAGCELAAAILVTALCSAACSNRSAASNGESILIGAVLPFTGREAAIGRNLEQAMLLAMEDVNNAGGINGVPLEIVSRDSNSGSERGLTELLDLIYNVEVSYLVGPEENDLATEIVRDIKDRDVMNILPGYAAPSIQRSTATGAWMRLAPPPWEMACALGKHAVDEGVQSVNTLSAVDDYNASLSTQFVAQVTTLGGSAKPAVTVQPDQDSYVTAINRVVGYGAERTLLNVYPATASEIVTEWTIMGKGGSWYLSPLLRADVFLYNIPYGALDGFFGLSPSLSLQSECETLAGAEQGVVHCKDSNSAKFNARFAARWGGAQPFPAAYLYYDAVALLAIGLQYGLATTGELPVPSELHRLIRELNNPANLPAYWYDLKTTLSGLAHGTASRFVGAGAEYEFDEWGEARHAIFDTWTVRGQSFVDTGSYYAHCWELR
jgi:ABC-type branched-subunit amino acid transport system substrate-binding protein